MDGHRPCYPQGELPELAYHARHYLARLLVQGILYVIPFYRFYHNGCTCPVGYRNHTILAYPLDCTNLAVVETPLGVIPDEHNPGTDLQGEERFSRITVLGEITLHHSLERRGFAGEHSQLGIIDFIGLRIMRRKTYNIVIGMERAYTGIEFFEYRLCHPVFPDGIQYLKEIIILLPMHLLQLYYYVVQFLQSLGMEEIRCRVYPLHILALAFLHHRGELVHITNHQ